MNILLPFSLFQQPVNVLGIVQRVVHEELEFGDDAQLVACAQTELETNLPHIGVDVVADFLCPFAGEDAQVSAADAHVGADAADTHADEHTTGGLSLALKDVAEFLLDEACNLILTCSFHRVLFSGICTAKVMPSCHTTK